MNQELVGQKNMRRVSIAMTWAAMSVALVGCGDSRLLPGIIPDDMIKQMGGPDVKGMDATMLDSAKAAERLGDYRKASVYYRQLADKSPDKISYQMAYGDSIRRVGDFDQAIKAYDKVLAKAPRNAAAKEGLGLALLSSGDYDRAGNALSEVMQLDRKRWRTLNGLGLLFVAQGMHEEALSYFTEALEHSSNNVSVLNNAGLSLAIQKKFDDAVEALELASSLTARDEKAVREQIEMNLALVYGIMGDMGKAQTVASRHMDEAALNNNMGIYAHLSKDDVLARSYLNMALSGGKHYEKAWKNLESISGGGSSSKSYRGKRVKVK